MGSNDGECWTGWCIRNDNAGTGRRNQHAIGDLASNEIHSDQVCHVSRTRTCCDLRQRARLHDAPSIEDRDTIGERVSVDGVVCYKDCDTFERVEV